MPDAQDVDGNSARQRKENFLYSSVYVYDYDDH